MLQSYFITRSLRLAQACILAVLLTLVTHAAHAINWNYLGGPLGGQPTALFNDPDGNTWAGMNGGGVFHRAAGSATWELKPGLPTQSNYE